MIDGLLVLDKPAGPTSHDAVQRVKRITRAAKAGHTGTLDPFATGVLPILLGRATVIAPYLQAAWKTYRATLALGRATDTLDPTGQVVAETPVPALSEEGARRALAAFVGPREQVPPRFSAQKVDGRPAYLAARRGEEVALRPKPVEIRRIALVALEGAALTFDVECSAGTYVRVLAAEIAEALGAAGHLSALRRLAAGSLRIDDATSFEGVEEHASAGTLGAIVRSMDDALDFLPRVTLTPGAAARVAHGAGFAIDDIADAAPSPAEGRAVRVASPEGALLALATASDPSESGAARFRVLRVLALPRGG